MARDRMAKKSGRLDMVPSMSSATFIGAMVPEAGGGAKAEGGGRLSNREPGRAVWVAAEALAPRRARVRLVPLAAMPAPPPAASSPRAHRPPSRLADRAYRAARPGGKEKRGGQGEGNALDARNGAGAGAVGAQGA
jgi:hypothetical protein